MKKLILLSVAALILSLCGCQADNSVEMISFNEESEVGTVQTERPVRTVDYNDPNWAENCWVFDLDADWPQIYIDPTSKETVEASMDDYFKYVFGNGITDLMVSPFEQISLVPTEADGITWLYEKCTWTEENGIPVDYSKYEPLYKVYTEMGIDIFEMAYKKITEAGIRPWVTLRMNDVHYGTDETSYIHSEFFYEAKENGYMLGDQYGYYATGFDFSEERVREVLLNYIDEIALKYDVFGIQLDFIREIYCFDYLNDEGYDVYMTDFLRKVNESIKKAEEKFGHPIKLSVRFGRSIEHNKVFGFDAETWVKEGLVDVLVPSPRWEVTDSAIPVEEWKALAGENVAVFAGMESRMTNSSYVKAEYAKGYSAGFYAKGADGIYFDNFYQLGSDGPSVWGFERSDLTQGVRRFTVTYQDVVPEGMKGYRPLPMALGNDKESLTVCMGEIGKDEGVYVVVGLQNGFTKAPSVSLNGVESSSVQLIDLEDSFFSGETKPTHLSETQFLLYSFSGVETTEDLEISFDNGVATVEYVELAVKP